MLRILQQFILTTIIAVFASQASAMFIQADWFDPTDPGVGTNRYAYTHNDPVNLSDPTGNSFGDLSVGCSTCDYYDHAEGANGTPSFGDYIRHPEAEAFIEDTYDFIGDVSGINGAGDAISSAVSGDVGGVVLGAGEIAIGKARAAGKVLGYGYDQVVKGYRSVSQSKLDDILENGFRPHPGGRSMEDKWFGEKREVAERYREIYPENDRIIEVDVPREVYERSLKNPNLDNVGPAFCVGVCDAGNLPRPRMLD